MSRRRIAVVGVGHRAGRFLAEIATTLRGELELVALCDLSITRMQTQVRWLRERHDHPAVPCFSPEQFETMVRATRPDVVLVATVDSEHDRFILAALALGCDVVTEKPMTTDAEKCARILGAVAAHPARSVRVAFNYRWAPPNSRVKEVLAAGAIGAVRSVNLEWLLDTRHGADYFRRWHSEKTRSGGLLVHKATHHFDLVNWWLDDEPVKVFAVGGLFFYGRDAAIARGDDALTRYPRYTGQPAAAGDPFQLDLAADPRLRDLYLEAEKESGYIRDRNVFRPGIDIEDTLAVLVSYRRGAVLSYTLNAFSPREGMRVTFNGDRGRLEYYLFDKSSGTKRGALDDHLEHAEQDGAARRATEGTFVRVYPHFAAPYDVPVQVDEGGHWGADPLMIPALFRRDVAPDPLDRLAGPEEGARSLLVGVAANRSLATGQPTVVAPLRGDVPASRPVPAS